MVDAGAQAIERFTILCRRCDRPLLARVEWVGREAACPHCHSLLRVPEKPADDRPVLAETPDLSARHCFNFACPRCDCLLEAHTGLCGQRGTCPTCGARFQLPFLDGPTGKPRKAVLLEGGAEDPTPVHAYGASGHQAPQIVQGPDGTPLIQCPRCNAHNPIDADVCAACAAPFTIEAATTIGTLHRDRRAAAALTFGIVGLVLFFAVIPGLLATWLGLRSVMYAGTSRRSTVGFAAVVLGLLSLIGGITFWYFWLK
jgi:hypothetical protein